MTTPQGLLLDRLLELPRERSAVSAVRSWDDAWSHATWAELAVAVRRAAGEAGERGGSCTWSRRRGVDRVVVDLALQFAGVVGERREETVREETSPEGPVVAPRDDVGRLVRMRQDTRPRDPAVRLGGRTLDHAAVAERAARVAGRVAIAGDDVVLVTTGGSAEQELGWAAVWGGFCLAVAPSAQLRMVDPTAWVCRAGDPTLVAGPRGERAPAGSAPRLRAIFVVGPASGPGLPPSVDAWRRAGVTVSTWPA